MISASQRLLCVCIALLQALPSGGRSVTDYTAIQTQTDVTESPAACSGAQPIMPQYTMPAAETCGEDMFLLIVVCSALSHVEQRNAIRATWASDVKNYQLKTRVVFLVGSSERSLAPVAAVATEAEKYDDVITIDMVDSYANLTYKSITMLHWVYKHCDSAKFILKTDDDMFINVPVLHDSLRNNDHSRFVMGYIIAGAQPIRDRSSKYYTPPSQYNKFMYPTYISGTAYVMSGDIVHDLYCTTARTQLFWLEDVYITGMCAKTVDASHVFNGKFSYKQRPPEPCLYKVIISMHGLTPQALLSIWRQMKAPDLRCDYSRVYVNNV